MRQLKITGNYNHAVECEGHPTLVFDNTTNVCVVVYVTIMTKDGQKHPSTLLVTNPERVNDAIEELKQSYGENYENIVQVQLNPNF